MRRAEHSLAVGRNVARYARHLLGVPYRYGGSSPRTGFDCSGFVRYVYSHFGVSLAHSSFSDMWRGKRCPLAGHLEPGDLVFFDGGGHVGIYVGQRPVRPRPAHGHGRPHLDDGRLVQRAASSKRAASARRAFSVLPDGRPLASGDKLGH